MNIIFNTLTSAELAERITAKIDMRGVAGFDNWPTAEPVMLRDVILQALTLYEAQTKKTIAWMEPVTAEEPEMYITRNYIKPADEEAAAEADHVEEPAVTKEEPAVTEHTDFVDALTYALTSAASRHQEEPEAEKADDVTEEDAAEEEHDGSAPLFEFSEMAISEGRNQPAFEAYPGPVVEAPTEEVKEDDCTDKHGGDYTGDGEQGPEGTGTTAEKGDTKEGGAHKTCGKWEEYRGKALSRLESKLITYGMLGEGYTMSTIASLIRVSPQTVCNWKNKRPQEESNVIEMNEKSKGRG